jgi:hypothetical protein
VSPFTHWFAAGVALRVATPSSPAAAPPAPTPPPVSAASRLGWPLQIVEDIAKHDAFVEAQRRAREEAAREGAKASAQRVADYYARLEEVRRIQEKPQLFICK